MNTTRARRTQDAARLRWYASWRARRFADHLGFRSADAGPGPRGREQLSAQRAGPLAPADGFLNHALCHP